jgi:hypothetical protein
VGKLTLPLHGLPPSPKRFPLLSGHLTLEGSLTPSTPIPTGAGDDDFTPQIAQSQQPQAAPSPPKAAPPPPKAALPPPLPAATDSIDGTRDRAISAGALNATADVLERLQRAKEEPPAAAPPPAAPPPAAPPAPAPQAAAPPSPSRSGEMSAEEKASFIFKGQRARPRKKLECVLT